SDDVAREGLLRIIVSVNHHRGGAGGMSALSPPSIVGAVGGVSTGSGTTLVTLAALRRSARKGCSFASTTRRQPCSRSAAVTSAPRRSTLKTYQPDFARCGALISPGLRANRAASSAGVPVPRREAPRNPPAGLVKSSLWASATSAILFPPCSSLSHESIRC